MSIKIELGTPSEPIDGPWRWYSCEYSLDDGRTWNDGEVQADGHMMAEETLVDEDGNPVKEDEEGPQV